MHTLNTHQIETSSMVGNSDDVENLADVILANGDSLQERIERVDVETESTCSTGQMRDLLGLSH